MPFKKRTYRKRYTPRRPNIRSLVRREINRAAETKHAETEHDYTTVTATKTNLYDISGLIDQGTNQDQRIGNRVSFKKLFYQIVFQMPDAATSADSVRFLIVQSRGGSLGSADMPNFYTPANVNIMHVLHDGMYQVSKGAVLTGPAYYGQNQMVRVKRRINLKNMNMEYSSDGSNVADKPLYLFMVSRSGSIQFAGFWQVYYKDT